MCLQDVIALQPRFMRLDRRILGLPVFVACAAAVTAIIGHGWPGVLVTSMFSLASMVTAIAVIWPRVELEREAIVLHRIFGGPMRISRGTMTAVEWYPARSHGRPVGVRLFTMDGSRGIFLLRFKEDEIDILIKQLEQIPPRPHE